MAEHVESHFVCHEPCQACGSRDNLARYSDGHGYCMGCGAYEPPQGERMTEADEEVIDWEEQPEAPKKTKLLPFGEVRSLVSRKIAEETCQKFGYSISDYYGEGVQVANYYDGGKIIAQKVRFKNKDFKFLGDTKSVGLYGQWLWKEGGKMVVVTEGEIDCLTVSQLQNLKWPVVSPPTGAKGAPKAIAKAINWLESFEKVIFMFDNDEPGQTAAKECAQLLTPGKAFIAGLDLKDPNDMLKAGRGAEVIEAIWQAKPYRPDGIVSLADIREELITPVSWGLSWPWEVLTKATYGIRRKEIYGFGAGTGVGKTDVFMEIAAHLITEHNLPVGLIFLEQAPTETGKRIAGKIANRRFHIPDDGWTAEELTTTVDNLIETRSISMNDHWGSVGFETVKARIKYMVQSQGIKDIFLDHLTALCAHADDERKELESVMADLAQLAQRLDFTLYYISHLATPEGKPHEEGGRVMIRHFKGARAIGFWSHMMFGLERNQQAEDPEERITTTFRCLKDRYTGQATGLTFQMKYDHTIGRLKLIDDYEDDDDDNAPF